MNKLLKKIRGTKDSGDFYLDLGGFVMCLFIGLICIVFGRGDQKWVGVFVLILPVIYWITPYLSK